MLGKLFKYEFRAVARTLVPLYLATLVLALVNGFATRFDNSFFTGLMIFALTAFGIAIFVVTIVLIIQRFWNNLLKDEGYLMFTLPVSPYELIASKLLSALIWIILGAVVGVASMLVWFIPLNLDALAELFRNFGQFMRELARYLSEVDISVYSASIKLGIAMLLGMLTEIQMLYLSLIHISKLLQLLAGLPGLRLQLQKLFAQIQHGEDGSDKVHHKSRAERGGDQDLPARTQLVDQIIEKGMGHLHQEKS